MAALAVGSLLPAAAADAPPSFESGEMRISYAEGDGVSRPAPQMRAERLANRYLVTFRPGTSPEHVTTARHIAEASGSQMYFKYSRAVRGFAAELSDSALGELRRDERVATIEPDYSISVASVQPQPANWGLDRIDQHSLPLNKSYSYSQTGAGVTAYIIDTGVRSTHREVVGRVGKGWGTIDDGNGYEDCNGHGTHVAGVLGGTTFGVAKQVKLVSVRVLDCEGSGTISGVVAGVDWVTKNHQGPSIANMSLGGVTSDTLDEAVQTSIAAGVHYVVAAGNEGEAACSYSPARLDEAITVGATGLTDHRASFSNFGLCVDLFAPGEDIVSADGTGDNAVQTLSGTSMAAPHVAGVAAQYLQTHPDATEAQLRAALVQVSTTDVLRGIGSGSPNRLLFSVLAEAPAPGAPVTMTPPRIGLNPTGPVIPGMVGVRVDFEPAGGDAFDGVRHELQRSADGGKTWTAVPLEAEPARSATLALAPGSASFRVRAIDAKGVAGPWATAPAQQISLLPQTQGTVYTPASAWADTPTTGGQNVVASQTTNATATFSFTGTGFAWFSGRPTSAGRAAIYIDGEMAAIVDLSKLPAGERRLAFVSDALARGRHTVIVKVLSAAVNKAAPARGVDIDDWATVS